MTRKIVSPIALDKSINTTEQTPRNIADVLAQQLAAIKTAIESGNGNLEAAFVCYYGVTTATQIKEAIEDGKVPYFYYNGAVAQLWKVETDKYTFRTTNTRSVEGQTILYIVDYIVNGPVWSTVTREVSGGSSSGQSYIASVNSLADFDTTGKSGMQDLISVANVPADGVYQVSVMLHITPKTASATKSDLVLQFTSSNYTGWPSHTFHAVVDDSQTFAQQLSFSTSVSLKAGQNTLRILCGGLNYLVFVDELTLAQLVNGVYHNGDDFDEVHTLPEAADFNNDDGVLVDGVTSSPRFMLWRTLANKVLGFIKSLSTTITAFRTGDVIPVDGPVGTAKMSKDDLLQETAENAIAGNIAHTFNPTRTNSNPYKAGQGCVYEGVTYIFNVDHYGPWDQSHVYRLSDLSKPFVYCFYRGDIWKVSDLPENVINKSNVRLPADASPNGGYIRLEDLALASDVKKFIEVDNNKSVVAGSVGVLVYPFAVKAFRKFRLKVTALNGSWTRFLVVPYNNNQERTMDNLVSGEWYEFEFAYDISGFGYYMDSAASTTDINVCIEAFPAEAMPSELEYANFGFKSSNLLNRDDKDVKLGYFITNVGGTQSNASYNATGYIPVDGGKIYSRSYAHNAAWYDEDKTFISAVSYADGYTITAPSGAKYIRLTFPAKDWAVSQFSEGSALGKFYDYGHFVEPSVVIKDASILQTSSRFGNGCEKIHSDSLASGSSLTATQMPTNNKRGLIINASMSVSVFDSVYFGGGYSDNGSAKVKIDTTSVSFIYKNISGTEQTLSTNAHGLTISDFLKIVSVVTDDGLWKVTISTVDGAFSCSQQMNFAFKGVPFLLNSGSTITNVDLMIGNKDLSAPVFIFGDSYLGLADNVRSPYWLLQWGFTKGFYCGFPGAKSSDILDDFRKALTVSKPKYVVWMLGMNDTYAQWLEYVNVVKSWCNAYGVELILSTIPIVPSQISSNTDINSYVTASGYRYIDQNSAVGANSSGQWYAGMLSGDNLHPSELGAKSIASQILVDFPELMEF